MKGDSRIFFQSHKEIRFENNSALFLGGAIYAMVSGIYKHCAFCFEATENNIIFADNVAAKGGASIYADPIYHCKINLIKEIDDSIAEYDKYFRFKGSTDRNEHNRTWNMSTMAVKIAVHNSHNHTAMTTVHYPGQQIKICTSAYDANNRTVFAGVKFTVVHRHIWLSPVDGYIDEIKKCTTFYLVIRNNDYYQSSTSKVNIYIYLDHKWQQNTSSVETVPTNITSTCPLGFAASSYLFGRCTCSKALKMFISKHELSDHYCSIKTQTFFRPTGLNFNGWAGKTSDGKFAVTATCPIGLCSTKKNLSLYYSHDDSTIELQEDIKYPIKRYPICAYNRAGPLCGKCRPGYTKVLGSLKCIRCSHYFNYWTVILIVLLAGPATVFVLYVLDLTLSSGTINGVLLYGNVVNINLSNLLLLSSDNRFISIAQTISAVFISIINCSLVMSVCFHEGLDEIQKTGISIIFPYLLLSIVMAIIVISRYSVWLSNKTSRSSVQVLVTVVHISISILLPAFVKTFSSILLYTDDGTRRVWLYDGSIDFLHDTNHIILTVVVSIAVLPLFTAYALFLVFGKHLIKCSYQLNLNFRQIYEAIHAPYKEGREYWFATRLYLLMLICVLSLLHTMEYVYLISALLVILFLIGQVLFHPYKTKLLNILDCWTLLNLALAYAAVLVWPNNGDNAVGVLISSIFAVLCTSIGIVIYHIVSMTGLKRKIEKFFYTYKIKSRLFSLRKTQHHEVSCAADQQLLQTRSNSLARSYYGACDDFREPLCNDKY